MSELNSPATGLVGDGDYFTIHQHEGTRNFILRFRNKGQSPEESKNIRILNGDQIGEIFNPIIERTRPGNGNLQPGDTLIVDCSNVDYMSSAVFSKLIVLYRHINTAHAKLKLAKPQREVLQNLQMTKLNKTFDICDTVDDALKPPVRIEWLGQKG